MYAILGGKLNKGENRVVVLPLHDDDDDDEDDFPNTHSTYLSLFRSPFDRNVIFLPFVFVHYRIDSCARTVRDA